MKKKEFLLLKIESTQIWRATKAQKYPDDERNRISSEYLLELYEYVENLSEDHPLFADYWTMDEYEENDFSNRLSRYGFDRDEEAEKFINTELMLKHFERFNLN